MMPYWMQSTLAATPAFVWIFFGLGLPWALALLPRRDWRDRPLALCLAFACGPALLTVWMFVLSLFSTPDAPLVRLGPTLAGTGALALLGAALAWRKRKPDATASVPAPRPLAFDEKLLLALIGVALVIRWLGIAYWPFTAYDALWVYGYEGRLYTLLGLIPDSIGYYPQFLPLQFTYGQLVAGGIDDHAARAGLIFLHSGAILAACVLGSRLFNRRAGIFAAALWALYPHVGEWSRFGDLEIPLTFLFTASSAFFLMAWLGQAPRRRYALISGLLFGAAMWTKPTAGAFVWGVLLLLALDLLRVRFSLRAWWPRFEVALIAGLACLPLGAVWYVRNLTLGHDVLVLPPGFWQTLAQQSGVEFGWLLLALLVLLAWLYFGARGRPNVAGGVAGLALVLLALAPSIMQPRRMMPWEWLALAAGAAILAVTIWRYARAHWSAATWRAAAILGWALALALPYFITWFFSYSYHYRLSFAIVPLLLLPTAVIVARWLRPEAFRRAGARLALAGGILALSAAGIAAPLYDPYTGWEWLWTDKLPDDAARYQSGNPALMHVVEGFEVYQAQNAAPLVVVAPGVKRLPFFFPLADIRTEVAPTRLADLEGVVYFVDSAPEGVGAYEGVPPLENQVLAALRRPEVMRPAWWRDDGIFRYEVYELHIEDRFERPAVHAPAQGDVIFGGFARFLGHDIGGRELWPGRKLVMHLYWDVLAPPPDDYMIYIHLRDRDGNVRATWDGPVAKSPDGQTYYSTLVWEPGEFITDERTLRLPDGELPPPGEGYQIIIGMYNAATHERVPVAIDGEPAGEGYPLAEPMRVLVEPPQ